MRQRYTYRAIVIGYRRMRIYVRYVVRRRSPLLSTREKERVPSRVILSRERGESRERRRDVMVNGKY